MCDHRSERPDTADQPERPLSVGLSAPKPSAWVERFLSGVAEGGRVLDVACGRGRHLQVLLERRMRAVGVDRDLSGAARFAGVPDCELIEADLETDGPAPFAGQRFDGVIVTNYLWRPLLPEIVAAVADDGLLIYETFGVGNEAFGRPKNPDYLLRPAELIEAVQGRLCPFAYEHGMLEAPTRIVQRICAVGPRHGWVTGKPPTPTPPRVGD